MTRFAHIADVHLGGWKQPELQELNFESFKKAFEICIQKKVNFVLIAGDLFDSAYPPIEILKQTFAEFKRLKDARIPCYIIAGSHDYSVSGKTFLDVLEKAGFCTNVQNFEEKDDYLLLRPTVHGEIALYGYPGKKSGLEIPELRKTKLSDAPGLLKIFMLHTTLEQAKGSIPIDALKTTDVPKVDYYALGHLHIDFQYENFLYPGPIFPNNFQELEDLQKGGFYIVDTARGPENLMHTLERIDIQLKLVLALTVELNNALTATQKILNELGKHDLTDKIILLRIKGELKQGKHTDVKYVQIDEYAKSKGAYCILRNTHELKTKESEIEIEIENSEDIEDETIKVYAKENPSDFNSLIPQLIGSLNIEKQEGETNETFENRLLEGSKKFLKI